MTGLWIIILPAKLKNSKTALKTWNQEVFGRVDYNIQELEAHLIMKLEDNLQWGHNKDVEEEFLITMCELDCWEKRE